MAEQSLYRRHRPQSFDQVVGQEHVVQTLRNAIERDRVHHAYLFVGSRGTGKTSMAKILARSLNCVEGPTVNPCGVCESCRSIAVGSSLDVIEMDAASNRSVDDIRELRERVGYAPAAGGWKIYILDEAHMLTREAWNAFLKTLEEPPPNTVFVLATTEAHKVMPTIVDRCQRFDFARPGLGHIAEVVRRAADAEGITISDDSIGAVARAANGSFRDALGTLDQLVSYSGTEIPHDDVLSVLGVADAELLFGATDAIAAGDGSAVLGVVATLSSSGRDPSRFAADLITHLRQLLVIATVGEVPDHLFVAAEHADRLAAAARRLEGAALVRTIDQLSGAVADIREGDEARMAVEIALLRAARPEIDPSRAALAHRLERVERALAGGSGPTVPSPTAAVPPTAPPPTPPPGPDPAPQSRSAPEASAQEAQVDAEPKVGGSPPTETAPPGPEPSPAPGGASPEPTPSAEPAPPPEGATSLADPPSAPDTAGAPAMPATPGAVDGVDLEAVQAAWPAVVAQVRESGSTFLSAAFEDARPTAVDQGTVEVAFPPSAAFNKRKAEGKENRERLATALRTILGGSLSPSFVVAEAEQSELDGAAPRAQPVDEGELVERFKTEFDAEELIDDPEEDVS